MMFLQNWLKPLITFLESNENFSVVQPKIKDLNNKKYFEYSESWRFY